MLTIATKDYIIPESVDGHYGICIGKKCFSCRKIINSGCLDGWHFCPNNKVFYWSGKPVKNIKKTWQKYISLEDSDEEIYEAFKKFNSLRNATKATAKTILIKVLDYVDGLQEWIDS